MEGDLMTVLLDAPREEYLVRIAPWLERGAIEVADGGHGHAHAHDHDHGADGVPKAEQLG
jgi:hypothetical protein